MTDETAIDTGTDTGVDAATDTAVEAAARQRNIKRQTRILKKELLKLTEQARAREARGIPAFKIMSGIQTLLIDAQYNLALDEAYTLAGWESRNSFRRSMEGHAMAAAQYLVDQAKSTSAYVADMDTIHDHPVHLWLEAWDYIKKSGRKLLSDDTYAALGETRNSFFERIADAHMDCAAQKLELARAQIDSGTPDLAGMQILMQVRDVHMKALGLDEIDAQAGFLLNTDANEFDAMEAYFIQWGFKTALQQPKKARFMEAQEVLNHMPDVESDPQTFRGTGHTLLSFKAKTEASLKERLHTGIQHARAHAGDRDILETVMQQFETDRNVYGDYDHDDYDMQYWFREIFTQYGYHNYDHFIDTLHQNLAFLRIGDVLEATDAHPVHLFNELEQAEQELLSANTTLNDAEILAEFGVDGPQIKAMMVDLAPYAANYRWNMVFHGSNTPEVRYDAMQTGLAAEEITRRSPAGAAIEMTPERLRYWDRKTKIQYAAECFAESMIALPGRLGVEEMIRRGFEIMDQLNMDLNAEIQAAMGMSPNDALMLDRRNNLWNLVQAWRDTHSERPVQDRFAQVAVIKDHLSRLIPEDQKLFYVTVGETAQQLDEHYKALARETIAERFERVDGDHPDPLVTFQITQSVYNAIQVVEPKALSDDKLFSALTQGNREDFLKHYKISKARHKAALQLTSQPFSKLTGGIVEVFARALDPSNAGEEAFIAMDDLSHALAAEGRTFLDADVVAISGYKAQRLRRMRNDHAIAAAGQLLQAARAKGDYALGIDNWREHPYTDFSRAFGWITAATYSPLSDIAYQRLGMTGRSDFVAQIRDAGLDFLVKLEHLATTHGKDKGSQEYLEILSRMRDLRMTLGFDSEAELRRIFMSDASLPARDGVEIDSMQRAIQYMAFPLCQSVFNSAASASYKYKTLFGLIKESVDIKAVDWKMKSNGRNQNVNAMIGVLLYDRIGAAMDKFHKGRANPATGVAMIQAFENLDARHDFIDTPWFSEMLDKNGYDTYRNFKGYIVKTRIIQIIRRIQYVFHSYSDQQLDKPDVHLRILNDLDQINDMCTSGLINPMYKNQVFADLGVTPDWVDETYRNAAYQAMPALIMLARDPFLSDAKRIQQFNRIQALINKIGPDVFDTLNVNESYADLLTLHHKSVLHLASVNLATDFLRGQPNGVSPAIKEAGFLLNEIETTLADKNTLRNLGLKPGEASQLVRLSEFSISRGLCDEISHMALETQEEIREGYSLLLGFYNHALSNGIDLFADADRERIGIVSEEDYEQVIDYPTFRVLNQLSQPLLEMVEKAPEMIEGQARHILLLMQYARLEERYDADTLVEEGLLSSAEIADLVKQAAMPKEVPEAAVIAQVQETVAAPVSNVVKLYPKPRV